MKNFFRFYGYRAYSSRLFLGCSFDLSLVNLESLKNHPSSTEKINEINEEDYECLEEEEIFELVEDYVKKNYGSIFYFDRVLVDPHVSDWSDAYEAFLAINVECEDWTIPELTRFFTNLNPNVSDQFRKKSC